MILIFFVLFQGYLLLKVAVINCLIVNYKAVGLPTVCRNSQSPFRCA